MPLRGDIPSCPQRTSSFWDDLEAIIDSQTQLKRISQLKSSVNLVLPTTKEQCPQATALPELPKPPKTGAMKRTEIPGFIFNDGVGRFDVDLAEDYTYSDMSGLKVFEKLWKGLLQWWTWNIKLVRALTKEEKAEVAACLAGLMMKSVRIASALYFSFLKDRAFAKVTTRDLEGFVEATLADNHPKDPTKYVIC
ncbi:hypothetical protein BJY01DRAFT_253594 [Aspergillus pseudoustus]|uniref:Uncharacterized protein n=1 Tax=Aspergillus pseudoustus TaxID=1810923 RepID=A0ABR4IZH5_9EURO